MSFGYPGQAQYGTQGGSGTIPDVGDSARAEGRVYQAFLILSGPLTIRDRQAVESVIRIIDEQGTNLMAIIVLEDGGIVSSNVTQMDFGAGIVATEVSPGVVLVTVNGITSAMITDGTIVGGDLADGIIGTAKIADFAVTAAKLADLGVTTGKIQDLAVTNGKLAANSLTDSKVPVGGGKGAVLWNANTRDTATSGRSGVSSTVAENKLQTSLTLTSPGGAPQKTYDLICRAAGTLEKTVSGNIEMRAVIMLGAAYVATGDWVGQQFGLQPISSWFAEVAFIGIAGDSSTYFGVIECRVSTGAGFFHGGTVSLTAIPHSMG